MNDGTNKTPVHLWVVGILVGLAVSTLYNATSGGFAIMGQQGMIFTAVIWLFAVLLLLYAHAMCKRGVLK